MALRYKTQRGSETSASMPCGECTNETPWSLHIFPERWENNFPWTLNFRCFVVLCHLSAGNNNVLLNSVWSFFLTWDAFRGGRELGDKVLSTCQGKSYYTGRGEQEALKTLNWDSATIFQKERKKSVFCYFKSNSGLDFLGLHRLWDRDKCIQGKRKSQYALN